MVWRLRLAVELSRHAGYTNFGTFEFANSIQNYGNPSAHKR